VCVCVCVCVWVATHSIQIIVDDINLPIIKLKKKSTSPIIGHTKIRKFLLTRIKIK
jgi:hypothetical protein